MTNLQSTVTTTKETLFALESDLASSHATLTAFCDLLDELLERVQPVELQGKCAALLWAIRQRADELEQISESIHTIRATKSKPDGGAA